MKKFLIILAFSLFFSCEDNKKAAAQFPEESEVAPEQVPASKVEPEVDGLETEEDVARPLAVVGGRYRKLEEGDTSTDCNCKCIDLEFDKTSEFCIVKDKIYINARCQKTGQNTADIYFVNLSREENPERKIPWQDFDTTTPIASVEFKSDGTAELDWIGFNIDGKLATDYAIYGKKSLEGTYKRN